VRRRSALAAALAVPAGIMTAGCDDDDPPPLPRVVIAAGPPDAVYTRLGEALAAAGRKRWKIPVDLLPTTGSVDNVRSLMDGSADIAFTTVDVADVAQNGDGPFGVARPIAALASLYDDYLHIVVRDDRKITKLSQLAGKNVAVGRKESAVDILARRLLNTTTGREPTFVHHEAPEAAALLTNKTIDAFFTIGALPDDLVLRLSGSLPIRLLSVEDETAELGDRLGEYFVTRSVPAGTYGLPFEVVTLAVRTILVVRRTMTDDVAYGLVRLLFDSGDALQKVHPEAQRLDERSALETFPVDLHPGVRKYYRDAKLLARPATGLRSVVPVV
jgi:TRAP transporter TAXI family solute receptor